MKRDDKKSRREIKNKANEGNHEWEDECARGKEIKREKKAKTEEIKTDKRNAKWISGGIELHTRSQLNSSGIFRQATEDSTLLWFSHFDSYMKYKKKVY